MPPTREGAAAASAAHGGRILWRHNNGAKWRALPDEHGPWWMAAQTFTRLSRLGVWERLLALVQEKGVQLGMTFLDGTSSRAHRKAAGAAGKPTLQHNETVVRRLAASRLRRTGVAVMGPSPLGDPTAKQPVAEPPEGLASSPTP